MGRGAQMFQKFRSHLKILDARWETRKKDPEISGATVRHLVGRENSSLGFLHPWVSVINLLIRVAWPGHTVLHCAAR
jgi:hypothetical protein